MGVMLPTLSTYFCNKDITFYNMKFLVENPEENWDRDDEDASYHIEIT